MVLIIVDCKAVEELEAKSEEISVELSQASLSSHQSNWKVKSRAQATGEMFFRLYQIAPPLTFHNAELVVKQVGLMDCKNQPKLLDDMQPHLKCLVLL